MAQKKRQQFDKRDNKEGQSLDENDNKVEGNKYILFPLFALFLLPREESDRLSDLGKEIRNLTHLVYISKTIDYKGANFALEFPGRGGLKL